MGGSSRSKTENHSLLSRGLQSRWPRLKALSAAGGMSVDGPSRPVSCRRHVCVRSQLTFGHVVSRLIDSREVRRLPTVRKLCISYIFLRLGFSRAYRVRNSMYEMRGLWWRG